jgi:hypothetical protein
MADSPLIQLDNKTRESVLAMMEMARSSTCYPYPWHKLEDKSELGRNGTLHLVVYGSLINTASAARTLSVEQIRQREPVIAFGTRRLFNYPIPEKDTTYRVSEPEDGTSALNVAMTGDINDLFNGVLVRVVPEDIPALRLREKNYDLVPVACTSWYRTEGKPFIAYTLCCPDQKCNGLTQTGEIILPNLEYYRVCRKGAAEFGDDFLRFWLSTTFLADGSTPVARWELGALSGRETD